MARSRKFWVPTGQGGTAFMGCAAAAQSDAWAALIAELSRDPMAAALPRQHQQAVQRLKAMGYRLLRATLTLDPEAP